MSDPDDTKRDQPETPVAGGDAPAGSKRSGRVGFDARGNSVWEWQLETGVYSRAVSTQKLKKLNLGELSIAETAIQPGPLALADDTSAPGGGFNPYNSAPAKQHGFNPYDNARTTSDKGAPTSERPKKPLSLDELRKLSEVIKAQRSKDKQK